MEQLQSLLNAASSLALNHLAKTGTPIEKITAFLDHDSCGFSVKHLDVDNETEGGLYEYLNRLGTAIEPLRDILPPSALPSDIDISLEYDPEANGVYKPSFSRVKMNFAGLLVEVLAAPAKDMERSSLEAFSGALIRLNALQDNRKGASTTAAWEFTSLVRPATPKDTKRKAYATSAAEACLKLLSPVLSDKSFFDLLEGNVYDLSKEEQSHLKIKVFTSGVAALQALSESKPWLKPSDITPDLLPQAFRQICLMTKDLSAAHLRDVRGKISDLDAFRMELADHVLDFADEWSRKSKSEEERLDKMVSAFFELGDVFSAFKDGKIEDMHRWLERLEDASSAYEASLADLSCVFEDHVLDRREAEFSPH